MSDDQPSKLKTYDPELFWKIDWKILPADFAFIVFGIILSRGYFCKSSFFTDVSPEHLLVLYLFSIVCICWFIGFILARYKIYYNDKINKAVRVILGITTITVLGFMMALVDPLINGHASTNAGKNLGMFASFFLVLGPLFGIGGYLTGQRAVKAETEGKDFSLVKNSDEVFYAILFCVIAAVGVLVKVMQHVPKNNSGFIYMVVILLCCGFVAAVTFYFLKGVKWALVEMGVYYRIAFIFEVVFPFLIISSLIFFNEFQRHTLGGLSSYMFLGVLFFTGIIPFRLILVFNPPLRGINLIIGIVSFVFYMWSVIR